MISQIERFLNGFKKEDVVPNLSALAKYCEDSAKFLDLSKTVLNEICDGSQALGVFGSRVRGTNHPDSDFDLLSIHRWLWVKPEFLHRGQFRSIAKTNNLPDPRTLSELQRPWIHITRIPIDLNGLDDVGFQMMHEAQWFWFKNQASKAKVIKYLRYPSLEEIKATRSQS